MSKFLTLDERFESRKRVTANGCWEWIGKKDRSGYGRISIKGKFHPASRAYYEHKFGELPKDIFVCHHCDNRLCFNPDHLFTGTRQDNFDDMKRKGRHIGKGGRKKLSQSDIVAIKQSTGIDPKTVAKRFNITHRYVNMIRSGGYY